MQITVNETGARTLAEARPMRIDGQLVYVVVGETTASLMVAGRIVAETAATGMSIAEAQAWAAGYRDSLADAVVDAAAEQPEADIATVVEALGYDFRTNDQITGAPRTVTAGDMAARIRNARAFGIMVDIRQGPAGEYIELHDGNGSAYGQYHFPIA
jgi:hypothetical protein